MTRTQTTISQEEPRAEWGPDTPQSMVPSFTHSLSLHPRHMSRAPLPLPRPARWTSRPKTPERRHLLNLTLLCCSVSPRPTLGGAASLTRLWKRHVHTRALTFALTAKALPYYSSVLPHSSQDTMISTTSCCQMSENHPHGKPVLILKCGG